MTNQRLTSGAESPSNAISESSQHPTAVSYAGELKTIRQREALARQEALSREETLLRQMDDLVREQEEVLRKLFAWREDAVDRIASLTPRQRQVMDLVLAGHPNKIIAAKLGISARTIESHRAEVMRKTDSDCLPALARLALAAALNDVAELKSGSESSSQPQHHSKASINHSLGEKS